MSCMLKNIEKYGSVYGRPFNTGSAYMNYARCQERGARSDRGIEIGTAPSKHRSGPTPPFPRRGIRVNPRSLVAVHSAHSPSGNRGCFSEVSLLLRPAPTDSGGDFKIAVKSARSATFHIFRPTRSEQKKSKNVGRNVDGISPASLAMRGGGPKLHRRNWGSTFLSKLWLREQGSRWPSTHPSTPAKKTQQNLNGIARFQHPLQVCRSLMHGITADPVGCCGARS